MGGNKVKQILADFVLYCLFEYEIWVRRNYLGSYIFPKTYFKSEKNRVAEFILADYLESLKKLI